MLQLENEYGGWLLSPKSANSFAYIDYLYNLTISSNFTQLLFTSDNIIYSKLNPVRRISNLMETANFGQDEPNLDQELWNMTKAQPDKPIYVSEYWTGWFDAWGQANHSTTSAKVSARFW